MHTTPTIGLITAIPEEFVAISAMIDTPTRLAVTGERSSYIGGTMPGPFRNDQHRVVATLMARAGNDVAATWCTNLQRTFPSVSVVVMCGIAAGIPSPDAPAKHVNLGDIVVATWGVIDYDHVDETDDGVRLRPGFPRPSPLLNNSANLLRVAEEQGVRPWERWLDPAARGLALTYGRPDGDTSVTATDRPGWPRVHYGLIGSADRSLRSVRVRDALAREHDLRALEMEGKGIGNGAFLNGLEWFVVRGVSDHGDRGTTATWRRYAALAAAAYTRSLLSECPLLEPRGGHVQGDASPDPPSPQTYHANLDAGVINQGMSIHMGDVHIRDSGSGVQR